MTPRTHPTPTEQPRATIAVPGGRAILVAEVVETGDNETGDFVLQALERSDGSCFVRIGYRRSGRLIRGPISIPPPAWTRLLAQAGRHPQIGPFLTVAAQVPSRSRRRT